MAEPKGKSSKSKIKVTPVVEEETKVEDLQDSKEELQEDLVPEEVEDVQEEQEQGDVEETAKIVVSKAEDAPAVTFNTEAVPKRPLERNVKVCLKVNHSCKIGGVQYHFERGKQVNVPASVKSILLEAGLLLPL